jgi:hypothetical protein
VPLKAFVCPEILTNLCQEIFTHFNVKLDGNGEVNGAKSLYNKSQNSNTDAGAKY